MAWSTPLTATASTVLTAAQWNASVRDNLLETPAAKATMAGTIFVGAGPNVIAERKIDDGIVDTSETTTSTTYVSLATNGPTVTMTTGTQSLVFINCRNSNSGTGVSVASFGVSGATATAPLDARGVIFDGTAGASPRFGVGALIATTPGINTFYMQYRVASGVGTFMWRRMQVIGL